MDYYVYVYLYPLQPGEWKAFEYTFKYRPFYIGKGKGDRCNMHLKKSQNVLMRHFLESCKENNVKPIILKVKSGLTESQAFAWEDKFIKWLGKIHDRTGFLTNVLDSGVIGDFSAVHESSNFRHALYDSLDLESMTQTDFVNLL